MLFNLKKNINTRLFNVHIAGVLDKRKVICDENSTFTLISQLCSRDLYMYLAAVKTFTRQLRPCKVIIVGDGLSERDETVLFHQVPDLELIKLSEVDTDGFPRGGTWERLLTIVNKNQGSYIIQLDADTLTLANIVEVRECIAQNRSFTLGSAMGQNVISFQQATDLMRDYEHSDHVQIQAELALASVDKSGKLKYVRGCSGFAGFAKGSVCKSWLKEISESIEGVIGQKWYEWGSEQVSSNILIANSDCPTVLPIAKYSNFKRGSDTSNYSFLHFLGEDRFSGGVYRKLARSLLQNMVDS